MTNKRWTADALAVRRTMFFHNRFLAMANGSLDARWRYWCLGVVPGAKLRPEPRKTGIRAERKCVKGQLSMVACLALK